MTRTNRYLDVATRLDRLTCERREASEAGMAELTTSRPILARLLIEHLGDAARAARWMSTHHRVFDGRMPWQVLADGEEDAIWQALAHTQMA